MDSTERLIPATARQMYHRQQQEQPVEGDMPKFLPTIATASLLLAAAVSSPATAAEGKVISQPNGRFAFGQISDFRRDQYMLDTATGRLWVLVCVPIEKQKKGKNTVNGDCAFSVLSPVFYTLGNNKYGLTPPSQ